MLGKMLKARDDRVALAHAKADRDEHWASFYAMEKRRDDRIITPDEWQEFVGEFFHENSLMNADIAALETRRILDRAYAWEAPVPPQPRESEADTAYWEWHPMHGRYYLTYEGKAVVRRETYAEIEMRYRLVLSWAAISISVLSLMVAFLKS